VPAFYFYWLDPEFGLIHVHLQSWFPFPVQVWINGREWLARQLDLEGIGYVRYQNTFLEIDDLPRAQELCERFERRKWPRVLHALARKVNPMLPTIRAAGFGDYYWVVDQAEYATDVMFRSRAALSRIYPDLDDHAMSVGVDDIFRFLGRKLNGSFRGEAVAELDRLCRSRVVRGTRIARFNPVSPDDCDLFRAVLHGDHAIRSFRNRDLQRLLHSARPRSKAEQRQRSARISRQLAKLRGHGLIGKVKNSHLYRPTAKGLRLMSAAVHYRSNLFPDALMQAA